MQLENQNEKGTVGENADEVKKFDVVGSYVNNTGRLMLEIRPSDSPKASTTGVPATASNLHIDPPQFVYCREYESPDGRKRLWIDEKALIERLYENRVFYTFKVIREVPESRSGSKRYVIEGPTGYQHVYTVRDEADNLVPGSEVSLSVACIRRPDTGATNVYFHKMNDTLGAFAPEEALKASGHEADFEKYFTNIEALIPAESPLMANVAEMRNKVESLSRLWLFDYLTLLNDLSYRDGIETLDALAEKSLLIRDMETWLLTESGILSKFSPEKREETRVRSEQVIERAEITLEAVEILKQGSENEFLEDVLRQLRKSLYIRNRSRIFQVLFRISAISPEFVRNNIYGISELVDFAAYENTDRFAIEKIINYLNGIVRAEQRQLNTDLHFSRGETPERSKLDLLIVGIGTLLNFYSSRRSSSPEVRPTEKIGKIDINPVSQFQNLCKYLSLLTDKPQSIYLINKSLMATFAPPSNYWIKGDVLRRVSTAPRELAEYILSMSVQSMHVKMSRFKSSVYEEFVNNFLLVNPLNGSMAASTGHSLKQLYTVPYTALGVGGFGNSTPWAKNESIAYYRDRWKALHDSRQVITTEEGPMDAAPVTIAVKDVQKLPTVVFCSVVDSVLPQDGILTGASYAPNFFIDDIKRYFTPGMTFRAQVHSNEKGKNVFDISADIRNYSRMMAEETEGAVDALCLSVDNGETAVFITEDGILAYAAIDQSNTPRVDHSYKVEIALPADEDEYPQATIMRNSKEKLDREDLLSQQLNMISIHNASIHTPAASAATALTEFPYVHLVVDNYLRLITEPADRYNLLHIAYLIAKIERSTLSSYYAARIQYMELCENFAANDNPQNFSMPKFACDAQLEKQFPSLKPIIDVLKMLRRFGNDDDIESTYEIVKNAAADSLDGRLARLSLAAQLIKSVTGDDRLTPVLRQMVASQLDPADDTAINTDESADEVSTDEVSADSFGSESLKVEFKTSFIYGASGGPDNIEPVDQPLVIMRVIDGFLNASGGTIYIGVNDNGEPTGIGADLAHTGNIDKYERKIRHEIVKNFNKDINGLIDIKFVKSAGRDICQITVPEYETPVPLRSEFYQRQGTETRIIKGSDLVMLVSRKMSTKN